MPRPAGTDMNALILAGARTPFAKAGAALSRVRAVDLGVAAAREALARAEIAPQEVDAVIFGNVASPADATNIARVIAVGAGLPVTVPAHTVNRNCASGMEAVMQAARMVACGEARVVIAGGVESMSNIPMFLPDATREILMAAARAKSFPARLAVFARLRPRHFKPIHGLQAGLIDPLCGLNMGQTAEVLAAEFGITREAQDRLALESHLRAAAAASRLREEMTPIFLPPDGSKVLHEDVGPRPAQTIAALAKLKPWFDRGRGTITPGNSSPITDGAAAVVVAAPGVTGGAPPLARIRASAVAGLSPRRMGLGPAFAIPAVLDRAGMSLAEIDLIEMNEAFAAQVLACVAALESASFARDELGRGSPVGGLRPDRTNVNGGAIALGHPVGASGARLILTLCYEMKRRGVATGLATLCVGGGQGQAIVLEAM